MKNVFLRIIPAAAISCAMVFLFVCSSVAIGQVSDQVRQRRRAFVGDLLQTILESQKDRNIVPSRPGRPNSTPLELRPGYGQGYGPVTPQMTICRKQLQVWEDECGRLVVLLRQEEPRLKQLRPLLVDSMQVLANVRQLRSHAGRIPNCQPLVDTYCQIDSNWRTLQHQLKQTRGLPQACLASVDKCGNCNNQLGKIFEVQPQFNRRELARYCTEMSSHFQHLTQDVYYDLHDNPNRDRLVKECRAIHTQIHEAVPLCQTGDYDTVVSVYKGCVGDWQKLKRRLVKSPHERVRRHCHEIESCGKHVNELLWLPVEFDYEYMNNMCDSMNRDIDYIFSQITLKDILSSPKPAIIFTCARDFQNQCGEFNKCFVEKYPHERMNTQFREFSTAWSTLRPHLEACKSAKIQRRLSECDRCYTTFSEHFDDGPVLDHQSMVQICANLDQSCLRLERVIQQRLARGYDPVFQQEICGCVTDLKSSIHVLHENAVASRRNHNHVKKDLQQVLGHWGKLRPMVKRCNEEDRRAVNQLRSRIEPLLVKLQVVYTDA